MFFHQTTLSGPIIHGLQLFRIYLYCLYIRIRRDIRLSKQTFLVSGVTDTADHMVGGVNDTDDRWWAVSMTPLTSGGRCQ
jgi:hypothetical protein